jgi:hypothetical protein
MWDAARIEPSVEFKLRASIVADSDLRHSRRLMKGEREARVKLSLGAPRARSNPRCGKVTVTMVARHLSPTARGWPRPYHPLHDCRIVSGGG